MGGAMSLGAYLMIFDHEEKSIHQQKHTIPTVVPTSVGVVGVEAVENTDFTSHGLVDSRTRSLVLDFNKSYETVNVSYNSDGSTVPSEIKLATLAYIKVMYDNNRSFFDKDVPTAPPTETIQLMSPYKPIVI